MRWSEVLRGIGGEGSSRGVFPENPGSSGAGTRDVCPVWMESAESAGSMVQRRAHLLPDRSTPNHQQ